MRALESLGRLVRDRMEFMHARRFEALWRVVRALIRGRQLWLTALGRAMTTRARPKHAIKAVDRLLGNAHLHRERVSVASGLASLVIRRGCRPIVLVDTMEIHQHVVALSASVAFEGRSIPLHSMVVTALRPKMDQCQLFLTELERIFPIESRPIVVTDGGFESEWFDAVKRLGWDYVGRVRGMTKFLLDGRWVGCQALHELAGAKATAIGELEYPYSRPQKRRLILSRRPRAGHRQVATRRGPGRDSNYRHYRKNAYEPLLLATSLTLAAKKIVRIYKTRMQIEQNFRDVKNHRWGWSFRHCGTARKQRVELLLLIATIASVIQNVIGTLARACGLHRQHQANTVRDRRVLSSFVLGGLVIASRGRGLHPFSSTTLQDALDYVRHTVARLSPAHDG